MRAHLIGAASTAGAALPVLGATGAGAADADGAARTALRAKPAYQGRQRSVSGTTRDVISGTRTPAGVPVPGSALTGPGWMERSNFRCARLSRTP
jgi:hypothetical protein